MTYTRHSVELSLPVFASAEDVHALQEDWGGIVRWWPPAPSPVALLRVNLIGDPADRPLVRQLFLDDGRAIEETLLLSDPLARRIYYTVEDGFVPSIRNYLATCTVDEGTGGTCSLTLSSSFDLVGGPDAEHVPEMLQAMYGMIIGAIQQFYSREPASTA